jgi:hypothetical protein
VRVHIFEKVEQILGMYSPGVDEFFARHNPDLWIRSIDEFEERWKTGDHDLTVQGLAVLEHRRRKLLEIYQTYCELGQANLSESPAVRAIISGMYLNKSETQKRAFMECDGCHRKTFQVGKLSIRALETMSRYGDLETRFITQCEECSERSAA